MSTLCEICGESPDIREILVCCWKSVCAKHKFEFCPLCLKHCTRIPHIICSCQRCQSNSISCFCENCKSFLCSVCSDLIHSKGKYSTHKVKSQLQGIPNLCSKHSMPLSSYCSVCGLCCFTCKCPHKKLKAKEAVRTSKLLQENYCEKLVDKIRLLKKAEKAAFDDYFKTLEMLDLLVADLKNEFKSTLRLLLDKQDQLVSHYNSLIGDYSVKSGKILTEISNDLAKSIDLYNLFSIPVPIHDLVLSLPETFLSQVFEIKEYRLPNVEAGIKVSLNTVNQSIIALSPDKNEVFESPKVSSPRHSLTKDPLHKRIDSQELPPRPSTGRNSIISRQNSGKFLSARSPRTSEDILKESLGKRNFVTSASSSSAVKLSWTHPSMVVDNLEYALECSLDGCDFKEIYKGKPKTCIVTELAPNTLFYFRVFPVAGDARGPDSEVLEISTSPE